MFGAEKFEIEDRPWFWAASRLAVYAAAIGVTLGAWVALVTALKAVL